MYLAMTKFTLHCNVVQMRVPSRESGKQSSFGPKFVPCVVESIVTAFTQCSSVSMILHDMFVLQTIGLRFKDTTTRSSLYPKYWVSFRAACIAISLPGLIKSSHLYLP